MIGAEVVAPERASAMEVSCPGCAAALTENYCSRCGEQRPDPERLRFNRLVRGAVEEVVDFEHSKLLSTFGSLFFHPGRLTVDYLGGARKRYLGPIKLFIFAFAISLLAYSILPGTAAYDVRSFLRNDKTGTYDQLITRVAAKRHLSRDGVMDEVNERWRRYLTWGEMSYPLSVAIALWLLYSNRRRYFGEHTIFALHYVSFGLFVAILLWPVYYLTGVDPSRAFVLASTLNLLLVGTYLVFALRRVYGDRWVPAVARALAVMVSYYVCAGIVILAAFALAFIFVARGA